VIAGMSVPAISQQPEKNSDLKRYYNIAIFFWLVNKK